MLHTTMIWAAISCMFSLCLANSHGIFQFITFMSFIINKSVSTWIVFILWLIQYLKASHKALISASVYVGCLPYALWLCIYENSSFISYTKTIRILTGFPLLAPSVLQVNKPCICIFHLTSRSCMLDGYLWSVSTISDRSFDILLIHGMWFSLV